MKIVLDIETVAAPIKEWAALVGLNIAQVESDFPIFEKDYQKSVFRSGPIRLNSSPRFLSGVSAATYAASLPVGSITA